MSNHRCVLNASSSCEAMCTVVCVKMTHLLIKHNFSTFKYIPENINVKQKAT